MTTALRKGETEPRRRYREIRFFNAIDKWYYLTREGTVEGPFDRRSDAEKNLKTYLKTVAG